VCLQDVVKIWWDLRGMKAPDFKALLSLVFPETFEEVGWEWGPDGRSLTSFVRCRRCREMYELSFPR